MQYERVQYERIVIGNGRDAVRSAIAAAAQGSVPSRVALVATSDGSRERMTSEVLRQAAERLHQSGAISLAALRDEVSTIVQRQLAADRAELVRRSVDVYSGDARLVDANTVAVNSCDGDEAGMLTITGSRIVLACGTRPARLGSTACDGKLVLCPEDLLSRDELPRSMIVVGAGRTGLDHAIVLAMLGVEVTVTDEHSNVFDLCGGLMDHSLMAAQSLNIAFRLGEEAIGVERRAGDTEVAVRLASGRLFTAGAVLVCIGKVGRTDGLDLESAGVGLDERGRIWCDASGNTWAPSISAVGDVIGFRPSVLAG